MTSQTKGHRHWYWITGLAFVPLIAVGLLAAYVSTQSGFRYDEAYFTSEYQELYSAPGRVARKWEQALRTGDQTLVAELTGLREEPDIEPNPDVILTVLLETDEAGYFHYLYFDLQTYERSTYYIKQVKGRWVLAPEDVYFYWGSGQWRGVFTPIAIVWWLILLVAGLAVSLFRAGATVRERMFGG